MTSINGHHSASRVNLDGVFTALSHTLRRRILVALMTDNPRWQDEFETVAFKPPEYDEERVLLKLHHSHLPHLGEAGFIDWKRETGLVTRGEYFEEIRPLLKLMNEYQDELPDDWP